MDLRLLRVEDGLMFAIIAIQSVRHMDSNGLKTVLEKGEKVYII